MHIPVLQKEVLKHFDPKPNENFIDCTVGFGGHALAILEKNEPRGKLLGIDADPEVIKNLKLKIKNFKKRIVLVADNFANLKEKVKYTKFGLADGILLDLGISSWHLEESGRGFSFQKNEPLDMRFNLQNPLTAEKIINYWSSSELERILREYGEEKFALRITKEIVEIRKLKPIQKSFQLKEIIQRATPNFYHHQKIHFATRTFQALRIAVNNELDNLKKALPQALEILKPAGRLVVISFHSLEDRIVKNFFKKYSCEATGYKVPSRATPLDSLEVGHLSFKERGPCLKIMTKKPIRPSFKEIKINPRCRSAKMRAAKKI